jgi:predicted nuclease with TOPRIM domain
MIKLQPDNTLFSSALNSHLLSAGKLTESVIEPMKKISDEFTLELENTYEKKKNEELQAENTFLTTELNDLRAKSAENGASIDSLKDLVARLQGRLEEKDRIDKDQSNIIKRLEKMCLDLKAEIATRNDLIKKLEERLVKIERQPEKRIAGNSRRMPYDEERESNRTIQSQIVPGHLLKDLAKPSDPKAAAGNFKKAKESTAASGAEGNTEELDDEEIESLYMSRLEFDR